MEVAKRILMEFYFLKVRCFYYFYHYFTFRFR